MIKFEDEIKFVVQEIYNGNDYLKEKRLAFIENEFYQCIHSAKK